jgi:hypothetical protein
MLDVINTLVDLNYDPESLEEILTRYDGITTANIEGRLTRFRETDLFKRLVEMRRPLLSQDLAEFRRLANLNREFAESAAARPDIELPRLRQIAAEVQAFIDDEYH